MSKIDPSLYLANKPSSRTGKSDLGKDEFLKILMAQLQNQDPLDPMKDKEFIAQMATFSSLEQLVNISGSIDRLAQAQSFTPIVEYSHLIGKQISYNIYDEEGAIDSVGEGVVNSISLSPNGIQVILQNGEKTLVHSITEIGENTSEQTTSTSQ